MKSRQHLRSLASRPGTPSSHLLGTGRVSTSAVPVRSTLGRATGYILPRFFAPHAPDRDIYSCEVIAPQTKPTPTVRSRHLASTFATTLLDLQSPAGDPKRLQEVQGALTKVGLEICVKGCGTPSDHLDTTSAAGRR